VDLIIIKSEILSFVRFTLIPNVVTYEGCNIDKNNNVAIFMELLQGGTLD